MSAWGLAFLVRAVESVSDARAPELEWALEFA